MLKRNHKKDDRKKEIMSEQEIDLKLDKGNGGEQKGECETSGGAQSQENIKHMTETNQHTSTVKENVNRIKPSETDDKNTDENEQGQDDISENGIDVEKDRSDVDNAHVPDSYESGNIEEPSAVSSKFLKPGRLKNLADLITVCRDNGIQIFNDTDNVPEKEKERLLELRKQGIDPEQEKRHRSDHLDPDDPKAEKRLRKSLRSVKPLADVIIVCRNEGKQVFNDKPNVPDSDKQIELQREKSFTSQECGKPTSSKYSQQTRRTRSGCTRDTSISRPSSYLSTSGKSSLSAYVSSEKTVVLTYRYIKFIIRSYLDLRVMLILCTNFYYFN